MPAEYGEPLSPRELEIVELVAEGLTNREIATRAFLSPNTVKVHLRNIFTKTGVASRTELTVMAMQEGWVIVPSSKADTKDAETSVTQSDDVSNEDVAESQVGQEIDAPPWPHHRWIALIAGLLISIIVLLLPQRPSWLAIAEEDIFGTVEPPLEPARVDGWEELPPLTVRRAGLATAAVGDRIYAVGGMAEDGPTGQLDVYDIVSQTWSTKTSRPEALFNISAVALQGKLVVPGGCDADNNPSDVTSLYNIATDTWQQGAKLPKPLCAYALTTFQNQAYLFGGLGRSGYQAVAYTYDIANDSWKAIAPPPSARGFGAAASLSNRIFYVGGYDERRELSTCASYIPEQDRWETCAPLLQPRGGLGLVAIGGKLQAIGGGWDTYLGFNERYTLDDDEWKAFETPLVGEWRNLGLVTWKGALYAIGGWNGDFMNRTYTLEILQWRLFIPTTKSGSSQ